MKSWRAVFWWQFKALPFGHQGWQIDVAEFIEFCIGCRVALPAALIELMKLRR